MELVKKKLVDLIPYENNPRRNDDAVEAVAESIRQCTYTAPIVVDEDNVILAGHTRLKALQKMGVAEENVIVQTGLTDEQKRKFRLLDNKTNEFAGWDFSKLEAELEGLDFEGFDFNFDSSPASIDDLSNLFEDAEPKEKEPKQIQCPHCGMWFEQE